MFSSFVLRSIYCVLRFWFCMSLKHYLKGGKKMKLASISQLFMSNHTKWYVKTSALSPYTISHVCIIYDTYLIVWTRAATWISNQRGNATNCKPNKMDPVISLLFWKWPHKLKVSCVLSKCECMKWKTGFGEICKSSFEPGWGPTMFHALLTTKPG